MALAIGSAASNVINLAKYVYDQFKLAAQNDDNCKQLEPALQCLHSLLNDIKAETGPATPLLSDALEVSNACFPFCSKSQLFTDV
jgi:hypothetical protein